MHYACKLHLLHGDDGDDDDGTVSGGIDDDGDDSDGGDGTVSGGTGDDGDDDDVGGGDDSDIVVVGCELNNKLI